MIISGDGRCTKMKSLFSLGTTSMSINRKMNYVKSSYKILCNLEKVSKTNFYMKKASCNQETPKQSPLCKKKSKQNVTVSLHP